MVSACSHAVFQTSFHSHDEEGTMSFLSTLFRSATTIDQLPAIATAISGAFQVVKKRWFNECVVAMDLGLFADKQETAKVVHSEIGGAAALAITGFQICCARDLVTENGYISKALTKDFLNLLCGRVSGVSPGELLSCIKRYDEVSGEPRRFRFAVDIARYVTNEEPSMTTTLHVTALAEKLLALTAVAIADTFGDSRSSHKLSRTITVLDTQLWPD